MKDDKKWWWYGKLLPIDEVMKRVDEATEKGNDEHLKMCHQCLKKFKKDSEYTWKPQCNHLGDIKLATL